MIQDGAEAFITLEAMVQKLFSMTANKQFKESVIASLYASKFWLKHELKRKMNVGLEHCRMHCIPV